MKENLLPTTSTIRWFGAILLLSTLIFLGFEYLELVRRLGVNIPHADIKIDYVAGVIWALFLGFSILFWPVRIKDKKALIVIWIAKSVVTLGFMLFYEANYDSLDAYSYFLDSKSSDSSLLKEMAIGAGTRNISGMAWLHNTIFPTSYHAMKVTFSMIGLLAVYLFYRACVVFLGRENIKILYLMAFFPSILFWSSILGKEPVSLLGVALYSYGVVGWYRTQKTYYSIWLVLGILLAVFIRQWMGLILLLPLLVFVWSGIRGWLFKTLILSILTILSLLFIDVLADRFRIDGMQELIDSTNTLSQGWATGGSAQELGGEFTGGADLIRFAPQGMFTALFRPLPGEINNMFGWLAGLENLFLIGLFALAILRTKAREVRNPIFLWAFSLIVLWSLVYGFVSYQNLGTAVRFKLQILPILLLLLMYFARKRVSFRRRIKSSNE